MAALGGHCAPCSAPGLPCMIWETPRVSPGWTSPERSQVGATGVTSPRGLPLQELLKDPSQLPYKREKGGCTLSAHGETEAQSSRCPWPPSCMVAELRVGSGWLSRRPRPSACVPRLPNHPSHILPLCLSPGHRPHVPPEVSLPPRDEPAVHQTEDAAARVHHQALRREGDLPGAQWRDAQPGPLRSIKEVVYGVDPAPGSEGQPRGSSWELMMSWPGAPHLPAPCHQAPHREVLLFARFTSFWIKTMTRSVRMCWTCSSAAGPR